MREFNYYTVCAYLQSEEYLCVSKYIPTATEIADPSFDESDYGTDFFLFDLFTTAQINGYDQQPLRYVGNGDYEYCETTDVENDDPRASVVAELVEWVRQQ